MLGFPPDLVFPAALSQRQMYALLGNSLSVTVAAKLVTHLLRGAGVLPEVAVVVVGGGGGVGGGEAEAAEGEDVCTGEDVVRDQDSGQNMGQAAGN